MDFCNFPAIIIGWKIAVEVTWAQTLKEQFGISFYSSLNSKYNPMAKKIGKNLYRNFYLCIMNIHPKPENIVQNTQHFLCPPAI